MQLYKTVKLLQNASNLESRPFVFSKGVFHFFLQRLQCAIKKRAKTQFRLATGILGILFCPKCRVQTINIDLQAILAKLLTKLIYNHAICPRATISLKCNILIELTLFFFYLHYFFFTPPNRACDFFLLKLSIVRVPLNFLPFRV